MLRKKEDEGFKPSREVESAAQAALDVIPTDTNMKDVKVSGKSASKAVLVLGAKLIRKGKLSLLDRMLHEIHKTTTEKVVIVSNWVTTLNVIQDILKLRHYNHLRLDGSTSAKDRQGLVDAFNRQTREQSFIFLLSAKAGGVGLNLIGSVI